ncbi:MAG: MerR family transcriptional regulator [Methylotenera sp.]|nr:MerR family transcriptional regulator [Methylotenera sp.]MDO9232188.1 MerR family transcriptional regulator [Methylotenera sp.]MDO9389557.1 MerR family transcriptional regulator [Methylotenera sp.]MDP2102570.1 MerR family transcriptional regulator [Methylotenera sp.]MDP2280294.1 MerR family transcriptional regulator [Methylotenera sp.]
MNEQFAKVQLPPIPAKRYFTIGEMSELCGVKAHVLRYWEQEFTQLKPVKRRGNRRYYQHHEVLLIRRIRELLYEEGFTISGARNRLDHPESHDSKVEKLAIASGMNDSEAQLKPTPTQAKLTLSTVETGAFDFAAVKTELRQILNLLHPNL